MAFRIGPTKHAAASLRILTNNAGCGSPQLNINDLGGRPQRRLFCVRMVSGIEPMPVIVRSETHDAQVL